MFIYYLLPARPPALPPACPPACLPACLKQTDRQDKTDRQTCKCDIVRYNEIVV